MKKKYPCGVSTYHGIWPRYVLPPFFLVVSTYDLIQLQTNYTSKYWNVHLKFAKYVVENDSAAIFPPKDAYIFHFDQATNV